MRRPWCGGLLLLLAAVLPAIAGCAGLDAPGPHEGGVKNRAEWAMPLDEFWVYPPQLDGYAENLLIGACLERAGYAWPVPWTDPEFPMPQDTNRVNLRLFDQAIAAAWGYHLAPAPDEDAALRAVEFTEYANTYEPDAAFDGVFERCRDEARDSESDAFIDALNYRSGLAMQAEGVVDQDPEVREALKRWQKCLTAEVDFTVPGDPMEMPPDSVAERFGLRGPAQTSSASVEEIRVATADAACRESSGWSALRYEREWEEQLTLISENRDRLDRDRAADEKRAKELLRIVAENAPVAP